MKRKRSNNQANSQANNQVNNQVNNRTNSQIEPGSEMRGKKDSESPTQYYLSELGLNLEWQNSLLQFGPAVS